MSTWKLLQAAYNDDGDSDKVRIDAATSTLQTIDYVHHERHAGSNYIKTVDDTGTSLILAFKVEDQSKEPHMVMSWKTEETATITWYEGATWTGGTGTTIVPVNSDCNSANTSILQSDSTGSFVSNGIVKDPTGLNTGSATVLYEESVWATNQTPASAGEGIRDEHILEPGETYVVELTSGNGGQWIKLDWYEHTRKN